MRTHHVQSTSPEDLPVQTIALKGIDGANPLGFLAALGALRGLTMAARRGTLGRSGRDPASSRVTMHWTMLAGAWRPVVGTEGLT